MILTSRHGLYSDEEDRNVAIHISFSIFSAGRENSGAYNLQEKFEAHLSIQSGNIAEKVLKERVAHDVFMWS